MLSLDDLSVFMNAKLRLLFLLYACVSLLVPYQSCQLASKPAIGVQLRQECRVAQDRLSHVQSISETLWVENRFYCSLYQKQKG
jgi:hypothetical protein